MTKLVLGDFLDVAVGGLAFEDDAGADAVDDAGLGVTVIVRRLCRAILVPAKTVVKLGSRFQ